MRCIAIVFLRFALAILCLLSLTAIRNRVATDRADTLVEALLVAPPQAVPYAVENLEPVRRQSLPILRQRVAEESREASQRLYAAVALALFGEADVPFLVSNIINAPGGKAYRLERQ